MQLKTKFCILAGGYVLAAWDCETCTACMSKEDKEGDTEDNG